MILNRGGQTMAHGPHAACHDFLCGLQKPQKKKIYSLFAFSRSDLQKKSSHSINVENLRSLFFEKKRVFWTLIKSDDL